MINLRDELKNIIGDYFDYILVRHILEIKCSCWRKESNTPDPECNNCEGLGWIFTEYVQKCKLFLIDSQIVSHSQDYDYGRSYSNALTGYLPYNEKTRDIKVNDIVYTLATKGEGQLLKPLRRLRKWQITDIPPMNLDNGKLEFIKILAKPLVV
jgi:hypothetical protein